MKFVVSGGAGFIGSHLTRHLVKENHSVIILDNLKNGKVENLRDVKQDIEFVKLDILDYDKLKTIINNVDGVFHEAALTSLPESFEKPKEYYKVNVVGTENIFRIAQKNKIKVVYASSSSVYGEVKKIPISENFKKNAPTPYANTKIQAENIAAKYIKRGVPIIGLRYFNVYGEGQTGTYAGVITKFLQRIKQKKAPIIYGDGSQVRDFIYVDDIAKINLKAMQSKTRSGFFNVGSGKTISILELANLIIRTSGLPLKPKFSKPRSGDAKLSQANIELVKKTFNWKPETALKDWLKKII